MHKNARLTPRGREWLAELIASGQTPKAVSEAVAICPRTVRKWFERYRREGVAGLQDRSSRPVRLRRPTLQVVAENSSALHSVGIGILLETLENRFAKRLSVIRNPDARMPFEKSGLGRRAGCCPPFGSLLRYLDRQVVRMTANQSHESCPPGKGVLTVLIRKGGGHRPANGTAPRLPAWGGARARTDPHDRSQVQRRNPKPVCAIATGRLSTGWD